MPGSYIHSDDWIRVTNGEDIGDYGSGGCLKSPAPGSLSWNRKLYHDYDDVFRDNDDLYYRMSDRHIEEWFINNFFP